MSNNWREILTRIGKCFPTRSFLLLFGLLLAVAGCDDESTSPRVPADMFVVSGDDITAEVGSEVTLTVEVLDESGNALPDASVRWQVIEGRGSLSATSSITGSDGRASVSWTLGTVAGVQIAGASVDGIAPVRFEGYAFPGALVAVQGAPSEVLLEEVGQKVQLSAVGRDEHGNEITDLSFEWESLDPSIAEVSELGEVEAIGNGETGIVVTSGEFADTIDVTVDYPVLESIEITADSDTIVVESTLQLVAEGIDEKDRPFPAVQYEWSSSDETTATVDNTGLVTSHAGGTVTLSAEYDGVVGEFVLVVYGRIHDSDVTSDETWTKRDSPHWVTRQIGVRGGGEPVLTIEPGAVIEFENESGLELNEGSTLVAAGTETAPILFTGVEKTPGFWKGIWFYDSRNPNNLLEYVTIEYGGGAAMHSQVEPANLVLGRGSYQAGVRVRNTILRHSAGYGLHVHSGSEFRGSEGNTFTQNVSGAASIYASGIAALDSGSSYTGNTNDHVLVKSEAVSHSEAVTWQSLDVPYRIAGQTRVSSAVTIEPGAVFEFENESGLELNEGSTLVAAGTETAPILFTGVEKTPGFWKGIWFYDSRNPNNLLEYVTIEYGGGAAMHSQVEPANLVLGRGSYQAGVRVRNTILRHSAGYGLHVHSGSEFRGSEGNTFTQNASGAASIYASGIAALDSGSSYTGNTNDQVLVVGERVQSAATWQSIGDPYTMKGTNTGTSSLTVDAGAHFAFDHDAGLIFGKGSEIRIIGTAQERIAFTGSESVPGWWKGIFLLEATNPKNLMEHVIVEYGGSSSFHSQVQPANLVIGRGSYQSHLEIRDSILRHSRGYGLQIYPGSTTNADACTANTFSDNEVGDCKTDL